MGNGRPKPAMEHYERARALLYTMANEMLPYLAEIDPERWGNVAPARAADAKPLSRKHRGYTRVLQQFRQIQGRPEDRAALNSPIASYIIAQAMDKCVEFKPLKAALQEPANRHLGDAVNAAARDYELAQAAMHHVIENSAATRRTHRRVVPKDLRQLLTDELSQLPNSKLDFENPTNRSLARFHRQKAVARQVLGTNPPLAAALTRELKIARATEVLAAIKQPAETLPSYAQLAPPIASPAVPHER